MIFNPFFPVTIVLSVSIGLILVFMWFEWKRNSRFFIPRCISVIVMIASLAALVLRPSTKTAYENKEIMLLTPGYSKQEADSLTTLYPSLLIKRTSATDDYKDAALISSDRSINEQLKDIHYVLGNGIPLALFDRDTETNFTFLPGKEPNGITDIFLDH